MRSNGPSSTIGHAGQDPVRIQLRLRMPLIWLGILLVAAFLMPDRVWNTLLVGLGGLFVVAYYWVWRLKLGLRAERRLRFGWVAVGDRLEEVFTIINDADVPALWVEVQDASNVPGYQAAVVRSVGVQQTDRWRETAVCQRRGQFQLGPWSIRSSDPFGIFTITRFYDQQQEIIIHPPIHGNLPIPLPLGETSGEVRARKRAWQATVNAASVRDYQPRDPYNWIHWPTSARKGELFVRQYDLDAAGDIWIVLDMEAVVQLGEAAQSSEEQAVLLAAALTARAIQQNRPVGLVAYGRTPQIVAPGRGQGQQWKILRALALLHADGQTGLDISLRDLSHIVQRGAAAAIITPRADHDWLPALLTLGRRGIESNVILLDRRSFGGEGNSEALRDVVRGMGFTANVIRQGEVGTPLEEQVRRGFWEFKVTGLGKVIAVKEPGSRQT